ncbi:ribonuclease P protein component [Acholeplasma equirhinis]|uniref:ribonuclease P protein component n=1 Tax=Acholeplasma equirhinis TaxID=555393 RepID=UPI00197AF750|nr:ribonuclease P protein component [Acholeplasma equirhinis]MBN3491047.1 ribonuclease P protein component [Acholeplasma equirhinis]
MKRVYSLKSKDVIDSIFKAKTSVGNSYFAIYYQKHEDIHFKYSISIGKKYGSAVERNLAKRRLRYILSKFKDELKQDVSFVIVVKPSVNTLKYNDILENIKKLLIKARFIEKEEQTNA